MNILVEGSRGKSGTVQMIVAALEALGESAMGKITGKETKVFHQGDEISIQRKETGFRIDSENKPILKKFKECKYKVFENQALSCYTMKAVHNLVRPEIILIPNIRFEHQDRLGATLVEQARSFAVNFIGAKKVITTEPKMQVRIVFQDYCTKYGVELVCIDEQEHIPSMQSLFLTNALVKELTGELMPKYLYDDFLEKITLNTSIKRSAKHGIDYFYGAKVNDVESTISMFNHMLKNTKKDFCFLCYFRKDRVERTEAFHPFFDEHFDHPRIQKFFFCGHYIGNHRHKKLEHLSEKKGAQQVIDYCKDNDLVLFTAINGVNDFMRFVEQELSAGD